MTWGEFPLSASFKGTQPCERREVLRSYCNSIIANVSHYQKVKNHENQAIRLFSSALHVAQQSFANHDEEIYGATDSASENFALQS